LSNFHGSLSFLSSDFPAEAGVDFDNSGEFAVEGGEAGFSGSPDPDPKLASRLYSISIGNNDKNEG
jgi:hypothetical protein